MRDDWVSRKAVFEALEREYDRRKAWRTGGLQLAWIESAVNSVPSAEEAKDTEDETWTD